MEQVKNTFGWLLACSLMIVLLAGAAQAAPQLDTSFGVNGLVTEKFFGFGDDEIFSIILQSDGKIVVGGYYDNGGAAKSLAVVRYLSTGEPDTTFSNDGIFQQSMVSGGGDLVARSLALQTDGKILVAGSADDGISSNIAVLRLTTDGLLDNTFADNGVLLIQITDGEIETYALELTTDEKILVAGTVTMTPPAAKYGVMVKLTADGQLDGDFGGGSPVKYDDFAIRAIALQAEGRILAAGSAAEAEIDKAAVLRINEDGSVDATYGAEGKTVLNLEGSASVINDITFDPGGGLFVTGSVINGTYNETFVGVLDTEGAIDPALATSGVLYRSELGFDNVGQALALQNNGSLLIAGVATPNKNGKDISNQNDKDIYLLSVDAGPDPTSQVMVSVTYNTIDLTGTDDVGNALAVMADGSVFVAGATTPAANKDFALLRFVDEDSLNALSGGVDTAGYTIVTKPVTAISRVGAVSGGIISEYGNSQCASTCADTCSTKPSPATCYSSCFATCELPTVTLRGVVYSIKENPEYGEDASQDDSTEISSSSNSSISSSTNNISGVNSTSGSNSTTGTNDSIFPKTGSFINTIVKSGQTEDGQGTGAYDSEIQEITPNTRYYLRAYAVLSDDTVIYGNEVSFSTDDACFIATAAYGSLLDAHVVVLREFRDRILMGNWVGQLLVGIYYDVSPRFADFVRENEQLRAVVRFALLPMVLLAYFIVKTGVVTKVCLLAVIIGALIVIARKTQNAQVASV